MATCLQIIQAVAPRLGISAPSFVMASNDLQIQQLVALANEEGQEEARRYPWTALQAEGTFTTLGVEDQGAVQTISPGLNYIVNDSIWNRSLRRPVFGPKTQQGWQQQKAFAINGPWSSYRIKAGHIFMYPVPVAGQSCYFEYVSKNWLTDTTGVTGKTAFTADDDVMLLDESVFELGVIWRFKQVNGFEYAEDFNKYERQILDLMARDGGKDSLNLTNTKFDIFPGVVVPAGSWNL